MRIKVLILMAVAVAAISVNLLFKSVSARNAQSNAQRVLGLVTGDQKDVVSAPATVRVGEDFQVTVNTFGSGCENLGDEGVILGEDNAVVMVYDFTVATRPGVMCTLVAKTFPHHVTLRFTKPGEAVIRIWVRRTGPDTPPEGVPIVLERRVTVNP